MELHERLVLQRKSKGLTQSDVAIQVGIDASTYAHYESGRRFPEYPTALKLSHILSFSLSDGFPVQQKMEFSVEEINNLRHIYHQCFQEFSELKEKTLTQDELLWKTTHLFHTINDRLAPVQTQMEGYFKMTTHQKDGSSDEDITLRVIPDWEVMDLVRQCVMLQAEINKCLYASRS